jgi:hypothetical protein
LTSPLMGDPILFHGGLVGPKTCLSIKRKNFRSYLNNNKTDVAGTHDHEDQSAETGDRRGRVFGLKMRIGRAEIKVAKQNGSDI